MRLSPFVALLPALAAAQNQIPLGERVQGWFNKAKSYIPTTTPAPVEEAAEKVVEKTVTPVNMSNWQSILEPSSEVQEWLIFVTGGNKTCFGRCNKAEKAFNVCPCMIHPSWLTPSLLTCVVGICASVCCRSNITQPWLLEL